MIYRGFISMASKLGALTASGNVERLDSTPTYLPATQQPENERAFSKHLHIELDLEDCREENRRLQAAMKQMRAEMLELNQAVDRSVLPEELNRLQLLVEDKEKRLGNLVSSLSWRVTAPLRWLARLTGFR